jgi:hypothetical protein
MPGPSTQPAFAACDHQERRVGDGAEPRGVNLQVISFKLNQRQGADIATNTTILITVVAMVAVLLAGILAAVVYKTRREGEIIRDPAENSARQVRHHLALADEYALKAHAAQTEVDIKTARARRLQQQASAAAAQTLQTPGLAG